MTRPFSYFSPLRIRNPHQIGCKLDRRYPALSTVLLATIVLGVTGCDVTSIFSVVTQDRGFSGFFNDNKIRMQANMMFKDDPALTHVEIMAHRGRVLLMGRVADHSTKARAVEKVKTITHVKEVLDHIMIRTQPVSSWIEDWKLSEKLKCALAMDVNINSQNFHVRVVERVAYLLGTAQNQQELRYVVQHAEEMPVLNVVKEIGILPPEPTPKPISPAA